MSTVQFFNSSDQVLAFIGIALWLGFASGLVIWFLDTKSKGKIRRALEFVFFSLLIAVVGFFLMFGFFKIESENFQSGRMAKAIGDHWPELKGSKILTVDPMTEEPYERPLTGADITKFNNLSVKLTNGSVCQLHTEKMNLNGGTWTGELRCP